MSSPPLAAAGRPAVDHAGAPPAGPQSAGGAAGVSAEPLDALADLVGAGNVMVLSGAGLSTESGIPDYRGPTGARRRGQPMTYREFSRDEEARRRYWARSHTGWRHVAEARPNAGHRAVGRLQAAGLVSGVVTQNVDGLHTVGGATDVVDLHGRLDGVVCLGCGDRRSRFELALRLAALNRGAELAAEVAPDGDADLADEAVAGFRVPACRLCDGTLKPDVIFFGESVPRARVETARAMLGRARSLLVLGSSLTVMSGYRFVRWAVAAGQPVAIVNRGPTRGDTDAAVKVDGPLGEVLPALVARLGLPGA